MDGDIEIINNYCNCVLNTSDYSNVHTTSSSICVEKSHQVRVMYTRLVAAVFVLRSHIRLE